MMASTRLAPDSRGSNVHVELSLLSGLLALYLLTINRQYQLDALDYATAARDGRYLFHPHHLLYNGFGYLLVRATALLTGGRVEPLTLLAMTNAVVTCAAVFLCGRLVFVLTGDRRLARGIALGYAIGHGIWYMATSVEVYPMAILFEWLALNLIAERNRSTAGRIVAAAICSGLAMCFHQTAIFATPALMVILQRRRWVLIYAAVAFGLTGLIYCVIGWHEDARSLPELLRWVMMYAHTPQFARGVWGGGLSPVRMLAGIPGFIGAFILPAFIWKLRGFSPYRPGLFEIIPLALLIAGIVLVAMLGRRAMRDRAPGPESVNAEAARWSWALWLWVIGHSLFTLWWESINFEFWLMIVPPLALLISLRLRGIDTASRSVRGRALLGLLLCLIGNLLSTFYPHSLQRQNGWRVAIDTLENHGLRSGDVVLTNEPAISAYASYFLRKPIVTLSLTETAAEPAAMEKFFAKIDAAMARDGLFLLETELFDVQTPELPAARIAELYQPRRLHAETIGTYPAYGSTWRIYRLHPR